MQRIKIGQRWKCISDIPKYNNKIHTIKQLPVSFDDTDLVFTDNGAHCLLRFNEDYPLKYIESDKLKCYYKNKYFVLLENQHEPIETI